MSTENTEETIDSSELVDKVQIPGDGGELQLFKCDEEYSISIDGMNTLMSTWAHQSEDALAELACKKIADRTQARVLIGGLGMGFTLAAALSHLGADAEVVVAELNPVVLDWCRGPLANLTAGAASDPRVRVQIGDVAELVRKTAKNAGAEKVDAIVFDLYKGPYHHNAKLKDPL